jgi:hypothetical protein
MAQPCSVCYCHNPPVCRSTVDIVGISHNMEVERWSLYLVIDFYRVCFPQHFVLSGAFLQIYIVHVCYFAHATYKVIPV